MLLHNFKTYLRRLNMTEPKESKSSKHFKFSIAKSGIRFVGYGLMALSGIKIIALAGILLIGAEVLGIMEEM
jgi:hypothetical protein